MNPSFHEQINLSFYEQSTFTKEEVSQAAFAYLGPYETEETAIVGIDSLHDMVFHMEAISEDLTMSEYLSYLLAETVYLRRWNLMHRKPYHSNFWPRRWEWLASELPLFFSVHAEHIARIARFNNQTENKVTPYIDFPLSATQAPKDFVCAICLDEDTNDVVLFPRNCHKFHRKCVNDAMNEKMECPCCRRRFKYSYK